MAAQTKTYQVKFETKGFEGVSKQFEELKNKIRNISSFSSAKKSWTAKSQPRSESGQFSASPAQAQPQLNLNLLNTEIK